MTGLRHRALEYFVAPESPRGDSERSRTGSRTAPEPPRVGVVGAVQDVPPVAALLAAELRLRVRAGCVLVGEWSAEARAPDAPGVAASRAARQLAARLGARELEARPRARSVTVRLPADPDAAAAAWRRALAAADCPSVWALGGARPAGLEPLLGELDLIVPVIGAGASAELGELAAAGLAAVGALVVPTRPVPAGVARLLAASSVATSRVLGTDVTQAIRAFA